MHTYTHILLNAKRVAAALAVAAVLLLWILPQQARAASTWNPTLLVNTESFQVIDEGDSATNIEIRFGGTLNEKIIYDRTNNRFQFSRSVKVGGALTVTGSTIINVGSSTAAPDTGIALEVIGTASGTNVFATKSMTGAHIYASQTFAGAGLTGCTGSTNKLTWNSLTKQFACESDSTYSAGQGLSLNAANAFSVNTTLTGSLVRFTTVSGSAVFAKTSLNSSGTLTVDGAAALKSNLTINSDNGAVDAVLTFGNDTLAETLQFDRAQSRFEFSDDVYIENTLEVDGQTQLDGVTTINAATTINSTLDTTGNITTDAELKINEDQTAADAILTFGQPTTNETATFSNARGRFEFSDDLKAAGNLSGSTLTIDGNVNIKSIDYTFPTAQGAAGAVLKNNGAGTLSWSTSLNNGSGGTMTLHPEYQSATYFSSGAVTVGTLTYGYDTTNTENYYRWTTSKSALNDYWTSVRVQLPKNFSHFETASGVVLKIRTTSTSAANNYVTARLLDSNGAAVALGNNAQLASSTASTWITKTLTNVTSGTYTAGGYITLLLKTAALTANNTDLGSVTLNLATTNP